MKCIVILIQLLFLGQAFAQAPTLLKCLGAEEKRIHLNKSLGPLYDLNQRLIAEMVQIPHAQIQPTELQAVCNASKHSESWKLLELSIVKGKNLFFIPESISGMQRQMTIGMIEDYVEASKEILLNFISQIQTLSPTPTCLKEEVPALDKFFIEVKYLQEDVEIKKIFEPADKKIFESLKNYPGAFERCSARLKKKLKSKSTPRPKKS